MPKKHGCMHSLIFAGLAPDPANKLLELTQCEKENAGPACVDVIAMLLQERAGQSEEVPETSSPQPLPRPTASDL